ncbi:hypothetical protein [Catenuloplanes indicus]|uniref:Uncharacterized protein n=1 Tax=Catenuloplanes indicus TaxID=137267 RepID=A0AAE3VV81_9ACTN|nr:hypothetical protein [Catenuloplanes indicus]MDQ0363817.1 hypothetical protein [Catenuloplanes indicus]
MKRRDATRLHAVPVTTGVAGIADAVLAGLPSPDAAATRSGTSYGNVRDGNAATPWSPNGVTGSVLAEWSTATTVSGVRIKPGATGTIGSRSTATPARS